MPNWNDVLNEISDASLTRRDAFDFVRRKYLTLLFKKRDRNIICYYSGWLQKSGIQGVEINDNDKNAFMAAIHGLNREKGLDLILHTPGGQVAATESLVDYLRKMFGTNIEVFIPQIAMSAGTMIACSARKIYMGKQSNIGPIDPQFGGISAPAVIEEFERASEEIKKDPSRIPLWQVIIGKYHPTFILSCENAKEWSKEIVLKWLKSGMFENEKDEDVCQKIVKELSDHKKTKAHARHISSEEAKKIGLTIVDLEDDNDLQDLVLTVHHAYIHTLSNTPTIKIVENHMGLANILRAQFVQKAE
jgi:membrane-bound ClpP family serine protease